MGTYVNWVVDIGVYFFADSACVSEAFEVENEDVGPSPKLHFLC